MSDPINYDSLEKKVWDMIAENLTVEVDLSTAHDYGDGDDRYARVEVRLKLGGKVISESSASAKVGSR